MSDPRPGRHRVAYLVGRERIEVREVDVPRPGPGELLLRVAAATTCGTDLKVFLRGGHPRMLHPPCPFGHEMAGVVAAAGEGVAAFAVGERVVVVNSATCGACEYCRAERHNLCRDLRYLNGAFGELLLVPERFVRASTHPLPDSLPFELAALTEPLACVLHGVESAPLAAPTEVVLYGAGPIGLMFVAVLAVQGHRVIVVDLREDRLAVARSLGAAATVVPAGEEPAAAVRRHTGDAAGAAVVIEATGNPTAWQAALATARDGGTVVLFGGCAPGTAVPLDTHRLHYSELTVRGVYHHRPATVRRAIDTLAAGAVDLRPLLTAEMPLDNLEEALRSMHAGTALKVVVRP